MKMLLVVIAMLFAFACTQTPTQQNPLCPVAQIGVGTMMNIFVAQIKTCSAPKLTAKVLTLMKCEAAKADVVTDKSVGSVLCPTVLGVLASLAGNASELLQADCDPALVAAFLNNPLACTMLFPK